MGEPLLYGTRVERRPKERLDSWKEIAEYLSRDVTTVQRWEKREGMPVHRHVHDRIGSVYAFRTELEVWMRGRNLRVSEERSSPQSVELAETVVEEVAVRPREPVSQRVKVLLAGGTLGLVSMLVVGLWVHETERMWRNPIADARFANVTDFDGLEQAAAISRDGRIVAFLSDRSGAMDIWITQPGSGEFHNLTHGSVPGLVNPSIRNLGFSPDGSLVTFWIRRPGLTPDGKPGGEIGTWAVPVLGGQPRPYLEGVAEFDWTRDGSRLAYHTPGPGDPLFVSDGALRPGSQPIFTAAPGLHSHFPLWSPDALFLYFVQGTLPDQLDVWRIRPAGGTPERITSANGRVSHPVLLDERTLVYLASDADGSGPWIYSMDVERRIAHRLTSGLDRFTSLAASLDSRRLVATLTSPKTTLWRMWISGPGVKPEPPEQIPLTTSPGFSPRLGADYLLYASGNGGGASIWKLANGASTELWHGERAQMIGGPALSPDRRLVAFSVRQHGQSMLYVTQPDGAGTRVVTDALELEGDPAWTPDGQSVLSAVIERGVPHLFRVPVGERKPGVFVADYSVNPAWSSDGRLVVYSGPDIGTRFSVKAVTAEGVPYPLPALSLTRGSRHLAFLPGGRSLVLLRGDIQHKDLWVVDLDRGEERQLTRLPADFHVRDFDLSPGGDEVVLERVQESSNIVLFDLPR